MHSLFFLACSKQSREHRRFQCIHHLKLCFSSSISELAWNFYFEAALVSLINTVLQSELVHA